MQIFADKHTNKQDPDIFVYILLLQDNSFMAKTFTSCLLFLLFPLILKAQEGLLYPEAPYEPGVIIFKLKTDAATPSKNARSKQDPAAFARELSQAVGAKSLQPALNISAGQKQPNSRSTKTHPLAQIYRLEIPEGMPLEDALRLLQSDSRVAYAEPYYLPERLEGPDDEFSGNAYQQYLENIRARGAWTISQGSQEVIIGILDTGVDFNHPDLKGNLYLNTADPIDGIDNDGDGFIDNYRGWDFANKDNDPTADRDGHGTFVTGFSSATTNNDIGIASTGYNCRYMPLKVFRSGDNRFSNGYEAMVYAAEMGCKVINLSWGSAGFRSQYVQDIINYVVLEKDVVIVAAAGNTPQELNFYPASFNYVLSVSASDYTDAKAGYASWSPYVDLLAPGQNVFSTTNGGGYGTGSGTSYASPQVAGAAGLVRSHFPELTALQVIERLRMSSDDVSKIAGNEAYNERIGKGRLNMEKALMREISPAVRMRQFDIFNGSGPFAFYNDTLEIRMDFTNFLSATTELEVSLSTKSPYVTLIDSVTSFPAIKTLEQVRNQDQPFRIYLHPDLPSDAVITFRLGYSDINYSDYQYFQLRTSGSFLDFKADDLSLTISSNGNLGYNFDYNLQGIGFRYRNAPLAHNLGLVIAQSSTTVANNMLQTIDPAVRNKDFEVQNRLKLFSNSTAFRDARSSFRSRFSSQVPLKLLVEQKILAWEEKLSSAGIVLEYRIINTGETAYQQLHTGLFADFDLAEFYKNKISWDGTNRLGYAYNHEENQYAGLALLSDYAVNFHALDISSRNGNQTEVADSISRANKYHYLSGGISKETAGTEGLGNDVAQFLGGSIPLLEAKQAKKIAFALLSAPSLSELQEAARRAKANYEAYLRRPPLHAQLLACPGYPLRVKPGGGNLFHFYADPYGKQLIAEGESILLENLPNDTTLYIANASLSYLGDIERIEVLVKEPKALFSMSADTLSLKAGETVALALTDKSEYPASWKWNFNNGFTSIKQSPKAYFKQAGTYTIQLEMTNIAGCVASSSRKVVVVNRNEVPALEGQLLCTPGSTSLQTADNKEFTLYADAKKQQKIFTGSYFETAKLEKDTLFYASSGQGYYESELKTIPIRVFSAGISTHYAFDSTAESRFGVKLQANIQKAEHAARIEWYINGALKSNEKAFLWPYEASDKLIEVQALVFYSNGCMASSKLEIKLLASPAPVLEDISSCKGTRPTIRPAEEGLYYFYTDAEKSELRHKGREYQVEALVSSRTFYVSNISLGQESPLHAVSMLIPDSLAYFSLPADTLGLNNPSSLQFKSAHPEITDWLWDFGDGFTSPLAAPEHTYTRPGNYTVSLTARSNKGCSDSFSRSLVVVQTTGLFNSERALPELKSYPNPVSEFLFLDLPEPYEPAKLQIRTLNGNSIKEMEVRAGQQRLRLSLPELAPGLYILQLQSRQGVFVHRFIKK